MDFKKWRWPILIVVLILLVFVSTNQSDEELELSPNDENVVTYQCEGGEELRVDFSGSGDSALVFLPDTDEQTILRRTPSASGAQYSDENGRIMLWDKAGNATLERNGEIQYSGCANLETPAIDS